MSDSTIALARATIKSSGGKEYPIEPPTEDTIRDFTTYLEDLVLDGVLRHRRNYATPAEFNDARNGIHSWIGMGKYEWGGDYWRQALDSDGHAEQLCWLVMRQTNQAIQRPEFESLCQEPDTYIPTVDNAEREEQAGVPKDCIKGRNIFVKIMEFITRPNWRRRSSGAGH
jgi:hypothetical protein